MANLKYKSFAKINLFLHILNKRDDGYHNLQTWFTFIDLKDDLIFKFNNSSQINISSNLKISSKADNLVYKAIKEFQKNFNINKVGVNIELLKKIPMGAGLGGGSSNAATTLIAMRDFYIPELTNKEMMNLAIKIGSDLPIFLYGKSAWAEGIGNKLYYKEFKEKYVLLVKPNIHITTKDFFESEKLIKTSKYLSKNLSFNKKIMHNDFEQVFLKKYPQFYNYIKGISPNFRITGTGSCFYLLSQNKDQINKLAIKIDKSLDKWIIKTLDYT